MSFDLQALSQAVARHGKVARVLVADFKGSAPRETGASMLIWSDGQSGTIGGGALEYEAADRARRALTTGVATVHHLPLGPALGQCCGGAVSLVTEVFDQAALAEINGPAYARRISGDGDMPLALSRLLTDARGQGLTPTTKLTDGWLIEPLSQPGVPLWIYGAGHVGRALIDVLAPLPDFDITWVDSGPDRFPEMVPDSITALPCPDLPKVVALSPMDTHHLILTYSHTLDLELCHQVLGHGFASAGLIGSATKWGRFRKRLAALGHTSAQISRICCPIGQPMLGKHPQAIAVGVASTLVMSLRTGALGKDIAL